MEPNGRYRLRVYDADGDFESPFALKPGLIVRETGRVRVTLSGQQWLILAQHGLVKNQNYAIAYAAANDKPELTLEITRDELRLIRDALGDERSNRFGIPVMPDGTRAHAL